MLNEHVLDAFRAANVPEDIARKAATSMTEFEPKLHSIELKLSALDGRVSTLQWMLGVVVAMLTGVLFKLFH